MRWKAASRFIADQSVRTKHTAALKLRLPGLIGEMIEPLALHRERQHATFERYRAADLIEELADHALMGMYRSGIINVQRIPDVLKQWEEPEHDWGDRTAWRMFNAATFALAGRVMDSDVTPRLFKLIDSVCEHLTGVALGRAPIVM